MPAPAALPPDAELVRRIRVGDVAAFEALFRAHHVALRDFAARLSGSPEAGEELVQDVFAAVWAGRGRWEVRGSVRGYLYGAVRNRATSLGRRRVVERRWLSGLVLLPGEPGPALGRGPLDPETRLQREEAAERVRRAVASLPERARLAVTLRWEHGLRVAEVAEAMGITAKGAEKLLARALHALRERIPEHLR